MRAFAYWLPGLLIAGVAAPFAQAVDPGRQTFVTRCAGCHGTDGNGGELGPAIAARVAARTDQELATVLHDGSPAAGMPAFPTLTRRRDRRSDPLSCARCGRATGSAPVRAKADARRRRRRSTGWSSIRAPPTCSCSATIGRSTCCARAATAYRAVTSQADWPSYNGQTERQPLQPARRRSRRATSSRLAPKWIFSLPNTVAPAGDAGRRRRRDVRHERQRVLRARRRQRAARSGTTSGRAPRASSATPPAASTAASASPATACSWSPTTRTSSRSIASPARCCGKPRWPTGARTTTPPARRSPSATWSITGTSGGDEGVRGFVAAFDQATGKEVWRFWTVPRRGEPESETWQGKGIEHPGATTWMTGTYDPQLDTLYWPTGNPGPGSDRRRSAAATTSIPIRSSRSTRRPAS